MNDYEAMFLIDSKLDRESSETVFNQIKDTMIKSGGDIASARVWAEKRKLTFPIKKKEEANYYLVNLKLPADSIDKLRKGFSLNESILRLLITRADKALASVQSQPVPSHTV